MLKIDASRHKEYDGYGSNERMLANKFVGGGGTKPRSDRDEYGNQNKVKQKSAQPSA